MRVAVIGAGPGGLVTLKYLLQAHQNFPVEPVEARIFEAEDGIGGTFRYRTYPEGEMVSSKFLTLFSDLRIPLEDKSCGDFLSLQRYVQYLEDYCDEFNLRPYISLSSPVTNVRRQKGGGHIITYTTGDGATSEWPCDAVAVCAGLHVHPQLPNVPGLERVPRVIHSEKYEGRHQFGTDTNVVILGAGETSMDMAYFAITSPTKSVTLCHRDGFLLAPKDVPNFLVFGTPETSADGVPPIDVNWATLFDSAYAHPKLRESRWPWEFYDKWNKFTWLLINGTRYGYGQHIGRIKNLHLSKVLFNKSTNALKYFPKRYVQDNFWQRLRRRVIDFVPEDTRGREIEISTFPEYIDENGVMHFKAREDRPESIYMSKQKIKPDVVICATGYNHFQPQFEFLSDDYPHSNDADVRSIWRSGDPTVGFIGFVRPQIGAIPPLAEFQAQLWVMKILGFIQKPLEPVNWYKLRPETNSPFRIHHGVDHDSYAYQLALDMDSAPSFSQILPMGPKVFLTWACGANFNSKFRLVGPWKWDGAEEQMRDELLTTVTRRQMFWGHIMLNALPISLFGVVSFGYWVVYGILDTIKSTGSIFGRSSNKVSVKENGYVQLPMQA